MSFGRSYQPQGGAVYEYRWASLPSNYDNSYYYQQNDCYNYNRYNHYDSGIFDSMKAHDYNYNASRNCRERVHYGNYSRPHGSPSSKRRKFSENSWGTDVGYYWRPNEYDHTESNPSTANASVSATTAPSTSAHCHTTGKRDRSDLENDDEVVLVSRAEIERCSPSRKDGIDVLHETRLRYSYCAFIQQLGMRLDLPQTTIGTAMVLCHRFFLRRSHASHDRFLIATAALFLAAKSEETARPLNDVVKASCEIVHKQDLTFLSYMLPIDWFEQYRERITEAEQLILTTLNFELTVQHPYDPLTSILDKLGLSQTLMVNLAVTLVNEGLRSSLWLQFKPHQIAAGIAYLAGKLLNVNLDSCLNIWREFQTPPPVLQDVSQQLMEVLGL
uniref:Cyclin-like domain-containing protein n=1 Tax=Opuntia streptacantha TaxID=393608 RepID=A0A7C9AAA3_OPUST